MPSAEQMTLEDCIASCGEALLERLLTPVELRTADGQPVTILSGDVNPRLPRVHPGDSGWHSARNHG